MQIFNNEITCYAGETFTLTFKLQNKDGSPYVIPDYSKPQYFVFSVAPSVYNDKDATRFWISCSSMLRFKYTDIIDASQLLDGTAAESTAIPNTSPVRYGFPGLDWDKETEKGTIYEITDYLFSYTASNGTKKYVYFENDATGVVFADDYTEYKGTSLTITFTRDITSKWGAQSYVYDLRLVAGTTSTVGTVTVIEPENVENKDIIIEPTKFKVLYDINEKGGNNSNGNN